MTHMHISINHSCITYTEKCQADFPCVLSGQNGCLHTTYSLLFLAMIDPWIEIAALAAPVVCDRRTQKKQTSTASIPGHTTSVCLCVCVCIVAQLAVSRNSCSLTSLFSEACNYPCTTNLTSQRNYRLHSLVRKKEQIQPQNVSVYYFTIFWLCMVWLAI